MKIDNELITKLETLSRLKLSDEERQNIQKDLQEILEMIQKIDEYDLEDIEPMIQVTPVKNAWREDHASNQLSRESVLQNAPKKEGPYFVVPKVVKK